VRLDRTKFPRARARHSLGIEPDHSVRVSVYDQFDIGWCQHRGSTRHKSHDKDLSSICEFEDLFDRERIPIDSKFVRHKPPPSISEEHQRLRAQAAFQRDGSWNS